MLSPQERLEQLELVFEELEEGSRGAVLIVEGKKDARALGLLGIKGDIITLSKGLSIVAFAEQISHKHAKAIVLTDWDRKGGQLARMLRDALNANGVQVDEGIRTQLAVLSKKEAKDIEGLPKFLERLRTEAGLEARRRVQLRFTEGIHKRG